MRAAPAIVLLTALTATPALAATATNSSWEGAATESQKQGPTSRTYGPYRNGTYVTTNGYRYSYNHRGRYHRAYRGVY